jgi:hypothetical protein
MLVFFFDVCRLRRGFVGDGLRWRAKSRKFIPGDHHIHIYPNPNLAIPVSIPRLQPFTRQDKIQQASFRLA